MIRALLLLLATAAYAQQGAPWKPLFDGRSLQGWKETPFTRHGAVTVENGEIVIGKGFMTGINLAGDFPKTNYELRMEAQRAEGNDFFAGITFPVNGSFLTWINGGWGGKVVGLSSLDGDDASENETTTVRDFQRGRWYRLWVAVTPDRVRAWIDDDLVIDVGVANREVGLRPGESELSKPLGIATYNTVAKVRRVEWRPL